MCLHVLNNVYLHCVYIFSITYHDAYTIVASEVSQRVLGGETVLACSNQQLVVDNIIWYCIYVVVTSRFPSVDFCHSATHAVLLVITIITYN